MTTAEKMTRLRESVGLLRKTVRHNGASLSANAGPGEIAKHCLDFNADNVRALWDDINTIDRVKTIVHNSGAFRMQGSGYHVHADKLLDLTPEDLMEYEIDDPRLTEGHHSWAVVKITKQGTELITYGGNYYQAYHKITTIAEDGTKTSEIVRSGDVETLRTAFFHEDAAWLGVEVWEDTIRDKHVYWENDLFVHYRNYYHIPCNLPRQIDQLFTCHLIRADGSELEYSLHRYHYHHDEEMIELPHGIWYVFDNSNLERAPCGILVPQSLADGLDGGAPIERIRINYSSTPSGLNRLRLVGDSFGDEYIVWALDVNGNRGGAWNE